MKGVELTSECFLKSQTIAIKEMKGNEGKGRIRVRIKV